MINCDFQISYGNAFGQTESDNIAIASFKQRKGSYTLSIIAS